MSAQVAADLRVAAEVLRRDGWTQDDYHNRTTGRRCMIGAAYAATGSEQYDRENERVDAIREAMEHQLNEIPALWNDAPGRTADEVIAALLAAADAAEASDD